MLQFFYIIIFLNSQKMVLINTLWVETFIMSSLQTLGCLPYLFGGNHALFVFEKSSLMRCVCEMGLPERKLCAFID